MAVRWLRPLIVGFSGFFTLFFSPLIFLSKMHLSKPWHPQNLRFAGLDHRFANLTINIVRRRVRRAGIRHTLANAAVYDSRNDDQRWFAFPKELHSFRIQSERNIGEPRLTQDTETNKSFRRKMVNGLAAGAAGESTLTRRREVVSGSG